MKSFVKKDKKLMKIMTAFLFVSSSSLILALFGNYTGSLINVIMAISVGVGFWLFLLMGYSLLLIINSHRKKRTNIQQKLGIRQWGIFNFFSNRYAFIFDIVLFVTLLLNVLSWFIPFLGDTLSVICIAVFVFSLHMHCILNGINYKYIKNEGKKNK